jgi:hypothetical protein
VRIFAGYAVDLKDAGTGALTISVYENTRGAVRAEQVFNALKCEFGVP